MSVGYGFRRLCCWSRRASRYTFPGWSPLDGRTTSRGTLSLPDVAALGQGHLIRRLGLPGCAQRGSGLASVSSKVRSKHRVLGRRGGRGGCSAFRRSGPPHTRCAGRRTSGRPRTASQEVRPHANPVRCDPPGAAWGAGTAQDIPSTAHPRGCAGDSCRTPRHPGPLCLPTALRVLDSADSPIGGGRAHAPNLDAVAHGISHEFCRRLGSDGSSAPHVDHPSAHRGVAPVASNQLVSIDFNGVALNLGQRYGSSAHVAQHSHRPTPY